ncbi:uncharacterized protein LOC143887468 isoform X1 [Tasmannia lanceolata]|uniref:uncharacterized protein LOC143887468 isoform X1 n=2 Tax=Tasmannia lanceolata TaxID=3420 RepID=UPI004063D98F
MAKYVLSRCCPSRFHESLQNIRLRDVHRDFIKDTPFTDLVLHEGLEDVELRKKILTTMVNKWDPKRKGFCLGGIVLPFLVSDVAKILGLSMIGERPQFDWSSSDTVDGWRFGGPTATYDEVVKVIHADMDSDEEDLVKSTVKHLILLFCSTVLFAQRDQKACSCLFPYIDLQTIGNVAWAFPVHEFLVRSLDSHAALGGKGHILGCSIILQVWLFEHTTLWAPNSPDAYPRLFKWTAQMNTKKMEHQQLINSIIHGTVKAVEVVRRVEATAREESLLRLDDQHDDGSIPCDSVGSIVVPVGDCRGQTLPVLRDPMRPIATYQRRERRRRSTRGRGEHGKSEVDESVTNSSLLERLTRVEREMREVKIHLFGRGSRKREGLESGNNIPTKITRKREREADNMDGEPEIVTAKGEVGDGVFVDDMGKHIVDDSVEHISIDSLITRDVRDAAAKMVILVDTPDLNLSKSKKSNKKEDEKVIGSIEKNVKQRRRKLQPSRAVSSPYVISNRKSMYALRNITGPAAMKVDALAALPPTERVIHSDGYHMCKEDLLILTDRRGWISSPIVNVYTDYLNLRDECWRTKKKGSCICLATHLPQVILDERCERPDACSRFVTRVENTPLQEIRKVLIPINIDMVHWVLLVLDMGHRTFLLYDSLYSHTDCRKVQPLVDYFVKWFRMVKDIDISAFPIDVVVDRPLQGNSHDCGLFVLKEMEYITRDASLDFTQKDITAMRASLLSEMLNGVYGKVSL